jgi:Fe(3+) dicitrate transport protein
VPHRDTNPVAGPAGDRIARLGCICRCIANTLPAAVLATVLAITLPAALAADTSSTPSTREFQIGPGPLSRVLAEFAGEAGVLLSFETTIASDQRSNGLHGRYSIADGFLLLLSGSGLQAVEVNPGTYTIAAVPQLDSGADALDAVTVVGERPIDIGPMRGLQLTKEQIPGNVQSITAEEIRESHAVSLTDLMNRKLQSVNVNDYQGNPFQMDIQYRGFTAGPQLGTPQGLSVFIDGVRVNEPFGDVVNWDLLPMNAIESVDVFPGSNPMFGLNTLGGAFTLKTKDGFTSPHANAEVVAGSFGRRQLQIENGWNNGTVGLFGAANLFMEDGWRQKSPSDVNQAFGKASYRAGKLDLDVSSLYVWNDLTGNGLIPSEMYERDPTSVFTSPDTTKNRLLQFQLSAAYNVSDTFSITGQVYRRDANRRSVGADAFVDWEEDAWARRVPDENDQWTCAFESHNPYGIPDYYVLTIENPVDSFSDLLNDPFILDAFNNNMVGNPALLPANAFNKPLPPAIARYFKYEFDQGSNFFQKLIYERTNPESRTADNFLPPTIDPDLIFGEATVAVPGYYLGGLASFADGSLPVGLDQFYYSIDNGVVSKNWVFTVAPKNATACLATISKDAIAWGEFGAFSYTDPVTGNPVTIDGLAYGQGGVVEGTPTAVFTDNQIDQLVNGASIQLNWNLDRHKFMVGAAMDAPSAIYGNAQRLGMLDADRNAFLAPDLVNPAFAASTIPVRNNDFSGFQTTESLYFSETWSPTETLNLNASARYNYTHGKNTVAARYGIGAWGVGEFINFPNLMTICNGDLADCELNYRSPDLTFVLNDAESERFHYSSFNPSFGVTWQAKENVNLYTNWAKGARVPSVIELGCAFDDTPVYVGGEGGDRDDPRNYWPKSLVENRSCSLPTTLSGDPYLPQIHAITKEVGVRGKLGADIQWNLSAYETNLRDDIYFVQTFGGQGFFDTVGKTRRRGLEAGVAGRSGRTGFSVNYSLTDATFQSDFLMMSMDNSSAFDNNDGYGRVINVKPDDRMPGVPLHNLNASLSYDVTEKWTVGLNAVAHSESIIRGNENNEHVVGGAADPGYVFNPVTGAVEPTTILRPQTTNPGKVPGYAVFNFQTSYKIARNWTAGLIVNNIFDKEYFSAGRLGRNPFSPSILGNIGPDGYNHNSGDWLSTNFIAPGAPRAAWITLNVEF